MEMKLVVNNCEWLLAYEYYCDLFIHDESVFKLQLNDIEVIDVGILVTDINNLCD